MPKLIAVIEAEEHRGSGKSSDDVCRLVRAYYTPDGDFLAERDAWGDQQVEKLLKARAEDCVKLERRVEELERKLGRAETECLKLHDKITKMRKKK